MQHVVETTHLSSHSLWPDQADIKVHALKFSEHLSHRIPHLPVWERNRRSHISLLSDIHINWGSHRFDHIGILIHLQELIIGHVLPHSLV